MDASIAVFGLISRQVAQHAGVDGMLPEGMQYVHDVRAALAETFASLRGLADSTRTKDLAETFVSADEAPAVEMEPGDDQHGGEMEQEA